MKDNSMKRVLLLARLSLPEYDNIGNKLFIQGAIQYLTKPDIFYDIRFDLPPEIINQEYDLVVFPQANILGIHATNDLIQFYNLFNQIKIPVFVLGIGAQAYSYDDIHTLCKVIKKSATKFIGSIYDTGGEFSLRGYFTKEIFDKLGFKSAVVTGCPSFYQMGRNLTIDNIKVDKDKFKPVLNGQSSMLRQPKFSQYFDSYINSDFVCQDHFYKIFREFEYKNNGLLSTKNILKLSRKYSLTALDLICKNKLKLFSDVQSWFKFLKDGEYNFFFGQRIHGNIASMLNEIPAVVWTVDSRTRELAEFFDIPYLSEIPGNKSLYDIYLEADYSKFNNTFKSKFDNFERFLVEHGISYDIDDKQEFKLIHDKVPCSDPMNFSPIFIDRIAKQVRKRHIRFFGKMIDLFIVYFKVLFGLFIKRILILKGIKKHKEFVIEMENNRSRWDDKLSSVIHRANNIR
jgi:hypothetical protein